MKYWNKDKKIRQQCWTAVPTPKRPVAQGPGIYAVMPLTLHDAALKKWCQEQHSQGKFYKYYGSDTWWFEKPEDAVWFMLRWL